jgi:RNase H-fold protein (predicted Holliday junction resolvase)
VRCDEFSSSIEATERLRLQRKSGQRRRRVQRGDIDSAAAAIILERWLSGEGRDDRSTTG